MSSSEIPQEVSTVIQNLSIIAGIPSGSKLNSIKGTYAAADSYIDNILRWFGNESSEKSLDYINNTIDQAIRISKKYPDWQSQICHYVVQIEKAILNLIHVYRKEPATLAQIEIIKLRITETAFDNSCQNKHILASPSLENSSSSLASSSSNTSSSTVSPATSSTVSPTTSSTVSPTISLPIDIPALSRSREIVAKSQHSNETPNNIFDKIDVNSFDSSSGVGTPKSLPKKK